MAAIAGQDPATFFRGAKLEGVDLRGQDLNLIGFGKSNVEKAILDSNTKIIKVNSNRESLFLERLSPQKPAKIKVTVYIPYRFDRIVWQSNDFVRSRSFGAVYGRLLGVGAMAALSNPAYYLKARDIAARINRYDRERSRKTSVYLENARWTETRVIANVWQSSLYHVYLSCVIIGMQEVLMINLERLLNDDPVQLSFRFEFRGDRTVMQRPALRRRLKLTTGSKLRK